MIAIEVKNIHKSFDRNKKNTNPKWNLEDINLTINCGETVGILGANGAGKSTLLKIITGVCSADIGKINLYGKVTSLLELGAGLNPHYTALKNIEFYYQIVEKRYPTAMEIEEILQFSGLKEYAHQSICHYSSGMFVRLAFALATSIEPDILIVDEALSVGDINFQVKCNQRILEYKKRGKTILFVSHSLDQIFKLCSKTLILNKGKNIFFGDTYKAINIYKRTIFATDYQWEEQDSIINYGSKELEILSFSFQNDFGLEKEEFVQGEKVQLNMDIKVNTIVERPIFAFTIKDLYGAEITGSNTLYEKTQIPDLEKNHIIKVTFEWELNLKPGGHTISLGITQLSSNGLGVIHRLYDILKFKVISYKEFVGIYDPRPSITIRTPLCSM